MVELAVCAFGFGAFLGRHVPLAAIAALLLVVAVLIRLVINE